LLLSFFFFFFSSRRRHTRFSRDWSSDVCSSDLILVSTVVSHWVIKSKVGLSLLPTIRVSFMAPLFSSNTGKPVAGAMASFPNCPQEARSFKKSTPESSKKSSCETTQPEPIVEKIPHLFWNLLFPTRRKVPYRRYLPS